MTEVERARELVAEAPAHPLQLRIEGRYVFLRAEDREELRGVCAAHRPELTLEC